jgi:hypothetical protein
MSKRNKNRQDLHTILPHPSNQRLTHPEDFVSPDALVGQGQNYFQNKVWSVRDPGAVLDKGPETFHGSSPWA